LFGKENFDWQFLRKTSYSEKFQVKAKWSDSSAFVWGMMKLILHFLMVSFLTVVLFLAWAYNYSAQNLKKGEKCLIERALIEFILGQINKNRVWL